METISITFKASDIGEVTLENISCVEYGTSENNLKKVEGAALATHRFEMGYNLYHIIGKGLNVTFFKQQNLLHQSAMHAYSILNFFRLKGIVHTFLKHLSFQGNL